jgi:hypothetical protein
MGCPSTRGTEELGPVRQPQSMSSRQGWGNIRENEENQNSGRTFRSSLTEKAIWKVRSTFLNCNRMSIG